MNNIYFTETEPTYCAFANSIAIILITMTDRFCNDFASAKDACIHISIVAGISSTW